MQRTSSGQAAFGRIVIGMFISALLFLCTTAAQAQVTIANLHNFDISTEGDGPQPLTVVGGKIYGTTGLDGPGMRGVIYSMNQNGSGFQVLAKVSDTGGSSSIGGLVSDGSKLYGTTVGQDGVYSGSPTIFSLNLDGSDLQPLHTYAGLDGSSPVTLVGSKLYGTTSSDGANDRGTVFSMNLDGTGYQSLYSFDASNSGGSQLTLIGSKLYGIGETGTNFNNEAGTIYSINLDGTGIQTLHALPGATASSQLTVIGSTIYGTTPTPSNPALAGPNASIFSMSLDGSNFQTLHSFAPGAFEPGFGVTSFDGKLFGSATSISTFDDQIFSINPDGSGFQQVLDFKDVDPALNIGYQVNGPLVPMGNSLLGPTNFSAFSGMVFALNVPEPATLSMAILAAIGLLFFGRAAHRRK
ncbi:MAG TPA: choice-of-anchor tandem repeat GloVer-containing protein [Pirellulales bacterium]